MYNLDNLYTLHCISWREGAPLLQEVREAACELGLLNPAEMQADAMDKRCRHALALSKNGQAAGCMRITPDGKVERMAVLPQEYRKQIETALMETVLTEMLNEYSHEHRVAQHSVAYIKNKSQTGPLAA